MVINFFIIYLSEYSLYFFTLKVVPVVNYVFTFKVVPVVTNHRRIQKKLKTVAVPEEVANLIQEIQSAIDEINFEKIINILNNY